MIVLQFRNVGGIENLVMLLYFGNDEVRRNVVWVLVVCVVDELIVIEICKLGQVFKINLVNEIFSIVQFLKNKLCYNDV